MSQLLHGVLFSFASSPEFLPAAMSSNNMRALEELGRAEAKLAAAQVRIADALAIAKAKALRLSSTVMDIAAEEHTAPGAGSGSTAPMAPRMSGRGGIWNAKRRFGEMPMEAFFQQQKPWRFCGYCGRSCAAMWLFCVGCRAKLHELPVLPRLVANDREFSESEDEDHVDDAVSDSPMGLRTDSRTFSAGAPTAGTVSARPHPTSAQRSRTRSPAPRRGKKSWSHTYN